MKKIIAVLTALMLILTGCRAGSGNNAAAGDIDFNNERLVKEFAGTVNIFHRYSDDILLSVEEGEIYKYYDINVDSVQVTDSKLTEMSDRYVYYEPVGDKGFIVAEGTNYSNTLKFIGRDNSEKVIAEDIGPADAINISIAPKAGSIIYTSLLEGSDTYGIYIYNVETSENKKLMSIKSNELIDGFQYMINWSPDGNNVIINDKYIYDTFSGSQKGELKSAYSQWSPTGSKIAFVPEDESGQWLNAEDYYIYPGKKVCIYDISKGSYDEVFKIIEDEYIFGDITWGGEDSFLAFSGIKTGDTDAPDWYMKLNYSSVYIVDLEDNESKRLETNADASDGTMIELGNFKFTNQGSLLSFTVGNYENSNLHIVNTTTLEAKTFENAEYLHWIEEEDYSIPAGEDTMYFCTGNSIIGIDDRLQEDVKYTSKTKLDDFYISRDGAGILIFELQNDVHIARYIGE
jgi:hypothetical protein